MGDNNSVNFHFLQVYGIYLNVADSSPQTLECASVGANQANPMPYRLGCGALAELRDNAGAAVARSL
jgi:hypothetical protein